LLRDPNLAADVANRYAALDLLQHRDDLLDGKALAFLRQSSRPAMGLIVPQNSLLGWTEKPRTPH